MKRVYFLICLSLVSLFYNIGFSEVAIIPYKIKSSDTNFRSGMGMEYAKLLITGSAIKKKINICSFNKLEKILKKLSINPQKVITDDDLKLLSISSNIDYFLVGTLSKIKDRFISKSILYSPKDSRILMESNIRSSNLFKLAEDEVKNIFLSFPNKGVDDSKNNSIDAAVLIDLSYNIHKEWSSVKKGIDVFSRLASDNWDLDSRFYIIPFSKEYLGQREITYLNSNLEIKQRLSQLKPKGNSDIISFEKTLKNSIDNIPWRKGSFKAIVIISNTIFKKGRFVERFILKAKRKGIKVYTISLGLMNRNAVNIFRQLSVIGKGVHLDTSYYQKIYDLNGKDIDLFWENGRFFHARITGRKWQGGLLERADSEGTLNFGMPAEFLSEIFFDEKMYNINPYNMPRFYSQLNSTKIINTGKLENNIVQLMETISNSFYGKLYNISGKKSLGRVLVSDGKISIWARIKNEINFNFFKKKALKANYFHLGIVVKEKPDEPYGFCFNPNYYITDLSPEDIPNSCMTRMEDIIKRTNYYISNGLFSPPIWFIKVKVKRIEKNRSHH